MTIRRHAGRTGRLRSSPASARRHLRTQVAVTVGTCPRWGGRAGRRAGGRSRLAGRPARRTPQSRSWISRRPQRVRHRAFGTCSPGAHRSPLATRVTGSMKTTTGPVSWAASGRCPHTRARAWSHKPRIRLRLCSASQRCRCCPQRQGAMLGGREANAGTLLGWGMSVVVHGVREGGRPWGVRRLSLSRRSSKPNSSAVADGSCPRAARAPRLFKKTTRARKSRALIWLVYCYGSYAR